MDIKKTAALLLTVWIGFGVTACGAAQPEQDEEQLLQVPAVSSMTADPEGAIEKIYENIDIKEISAADDTLMEETLGFDLSTIEEYYVRYSSGRYGLADIYIVRPVEEKYDAVREQLEEIKYNRIASTADYDVLDASKIARGAEIFQYGGYLIMLMLADNNAAEAVIETYIPSTEIISK